MLAPCTAIVADLGSPSARSKGMVRPWGFGVGVSGAWVSLLAKHPLSPGSHRGWPFSGFPLWAPPWEPSCPRRRCLGWPCSLPSLTCCSSALLPETLPHRSGYGSQTAPRLAGGDAHQVSQLQVLEGRATPFWCPDALESAAPPGTPWFPDPRPRWGSARCRGRKWFVKPTPRPPSGPQCWPRRRRPSPWGFRAAVDLLSPGPARPRLWRGAQTRPLSQ